MKYLLCILAVSAFSFGCSKSTDSSVKFLGRWQLTEVQVGFGALEWQAVDQTTPQYIDFGVDRKIRVIPAQQDQPVPGFEILNDSTINLTGIIMTMPVKMYINVNGDQLITNMSGCIEGCFRKYKLVIKY